VSQTKYHHTGNILAMVVGSGGVFIADFDLPIPTSDESAASSHWAIPEDPYSSDVVQLSSTAQVLFELDYFEKNGSSATEGVWEKEKASHRSIYADATDGNSGESASDPSAVISVDEELELYLNHAYAASSSGAGAAGAAAAGEQGDLPDSGSYIAAYLGRYLDNSDIPICDFPRLGFNIIERVKVVSSTKSDGDVRRKSRKALQPIKSFQLERVKQSLRDMGKPGGLTVDTYMNLKRILDLLNSNAGCHKLNPGMTYHARARMISDETALRWIEDFEQDYLIFQHALCAVEWDTKLNAKTLSMIRGFVKEAELALEGQGIMQRRGF
jgi:hypothetical protein